MSTPEQVPAAESPYAPPRAVVADVAGPPMERPALVTRAVRCLWISLAFGMLFTLWKLAMPAPALRTLGPGSSGAFGSFVMVTVAMYAVIFLVSAWIYSAIAKGRNWARIIYIVFAVLSILSIPGIILSLRAGTSSAVEALLFAVNFGLSFYVVYLLLTRPAREWFRYMKEQS